MGFATPSTISRFPPSRSFPHRDKCTRRDGVDGETAGEIQNAIDHPRSRVETTVERTLLAELGGGCIAPIGIYAILQGEYVHTRVSVFDRDGEESVTATRDLPVDHHAEAAREFATDLADRGAAELIEEARDDAGAGTSVSEDDQPEGSKRCRRTRRDQTAIRLPKRMQSSSRVPSTSSGAVPAIRSY